MTAALAFGAFFGLMLVGVPIAVALGIGGVLAVVLTGADAPWFGLFAVQQNFDGSISKYPLLALPMFVLVGSVFDRSGVASRLVNFAVAIVGRGPGMLPIVAILVSMLLGGISGSAAACAAAVGGVMLAAMARAGYPAPFSATVVGSAAATDVLIPPSLAFVVYSLMVPGVSLPALFAAGMIPGVLAGVALIVPAWWLARRHRMGAAERDLPRPPFWRSLREASWGLATPVLILGGMRLGWFTPTEAAVVTAAYGLFVGMVIHRTITWRDLHDIFAESSVVSAVIMLILGMAGVFAFAVSTLGVADPLANAFKWTGLGSLGTLILVLVALKLIGIVLDGVSVFMVFVPLLLPLVRAFGWDPIWFGVLVTMVMALGQFTPPLAVNLLVACRLANTSIEKTVPWVGWFFASFVVAIAAVIAWPDLALWLPKVAGY